MPNRYFSSAAYRYGFNGMEKDDEMKGVTGGSYTTYFRQYDPRLGRFMSMDPVNYPWQSDYAAFNNNPIYFADPSGAEGEEKGKGGGKAKRADRKANKKAERQKAKTGDGVSLSDDELSTVNENGSIIGGSMDEFILIDDKPKSAVGKILAKIGGDLKVVSPEVRGVIAVYNFLDAARHGIQIYGDATNSSESLAGKGNKDDPFNASIDFSEVSKMMALIKTRLGRKSPADRKEIMDAARKKFRADKDFNSSSKLTNKMFKVLFQAMNENDVSNNNNNANNQIHSGDPNKKVNEVETNKLTQGTNIGTYNGKKAELDIGSQGDTISARIYIANPWKELNSAVKDSIFGNKIYLK